MKSKIKNFLFGILVILMLISAVPIYAVDKDSTSEDSANNYKSGIIYIWDEENGEYVENPSSQKHLYDVAVGEEFKLMAILDNPNMNGSLPDIGQTQGSGLWSMGNTGGNTNLSITTEWKCLDVDTNKWQQIATCKALKEGKCTNAGQFWADCYIMNLSYNGTAQKDVFCIRATIPSKIHIDNINLGTQNFDDVDANIATKMFNGENSGKNSTSNRYKVFVGDTLDIFTNDTDGNKFEISSSASCIKDVTSDSSWIKEDDGKVKASYLGLSEGDCEIQLKNDQDAVIETLYISICNPIYVNTALGEVQKDFAHEYIFTALEWLYKQEPDRFITTPKGEPLYTRNLNEYLCQYYMYTGDTVVLTTYLDSSNSSSFTTSSGIEAVGEPVIEDLKNGFKKITQEFKLISSTSDDVETISSGKTKFYISVQDPTSVAGGDHFDIEATGYYVSEEININVEETTRTETIYDSFVSAVNLCTIYGLDDEGNEKVLGTLESGEYWKRLFENTVQYEVTSAYKTKDGRLLDNDGADIDDDVKAGKKVPEVAIRDDIKVSDVKRVVFDVELSCIPQKKTIEKGTVDQDKNFTCNGESNVIVYNDSNRPKTEVHSSVIIDMGARDILDALNRCPDHSGFDFNAKAQRKIINSYGDLLITKNVEESEPDLNKEYMFTVTLKDDEEKICKDISGVYGELEFTEGVGKFSLKNGANKTIKNLPAGVHYVVEEDNDDNYISKSLDSTGVISEANVSQVTYTNTRKTGNLSITKLVTGDLIDTNKEFSFKIVLLDENAKPLTGKYSITYENKKDNTEDKKTISSGDTFKLKHNEKITISGLPTNTVYSISEVEADKDGYITTSADETGTIKYGETSEVIFTNQFVYTLPETGSAFPLILLIMAGFFSVTGIAMTNKRKQ